MTSAPHLLRHAGRVATSYVGLVVGSLIVILVSMNALATAQTRWQLFRSLRFEEISFAPTELASYAQQGDTRTVVITFNRGVAESLKQTVTSLAGMIPAVSSRIIAEAQREDTARATLATGGGFNRRQLTQRLIRLSFQADDGVHRGARATDLARVQVRRHD